MDLEEESSVRYQWISKIGKLCIAHRTKTMIPERSSYLIFVSRSSRQTMQKKQWHPNLLFTGHQWHHLKNEQKKNCLKQVKWVKVSWWILIRRFSTWSKCDWQSKFRRTLNRSRHSSRVYLNWGDMEGDEDATQATCRQIMKQFCWIINDVSQQRVNREYMFEICSCCIFVTFVSLKSFCRDTNEHRIVVTLNTWF